MAKYWSTSSNGRSVFLAMFNKRWCTDADTFFAKCDCSQFCLKVRTHNFLDAANSCKLHQLSGFGLYSFAVEFQRFEHSIHADFVPILETIRQCFFHAVNTDGRILNRVFLDTGGKSLAGKPIDLNWWKA